MTIKIPKKFFNFKSLLLTFKMSTIIKLNAKCKSLAAAHWYLFFSVAMKAVNTSVTHLTSLRVPHVVCVTSGPCLRLWASLWVSVPGPGDHGDPGRGEVMRPQAVSPVSHSGCLWWSLSYQLGQYKLNKHCEILVSCSDNERNWRSQN